MYKYCIFLLLFIPFFILSQRENRLIEDGEFSKAYNHLTKSYSKDSNDIQTNFYLSKLYIQSRNNSFFSVKLSYDHYLRTKQLLTSITELKDIEKLNKSGISKEILINLRDTIFYFSYKEASTINTEQSYINFILLDEEIPLLIRNKAIEQRNICAFQNAKKNNSVQDFDNFIIKYPNAKQFYEALDLRDSLAFEIAKTQNSLQSYKDFLIKYPNSKLKNKVIALVHLHAFNLAAKENNILSFENFISEYPNAIQINEAKLKIEELNYLETFESKSIEKCYGFITKYQNSKFKDTVLKLLEDLKFSLIQSNASISDIESFISEFPYSNKNEKLISHIDSLYFLKLSISENVEEIQVFLNNYPKSKNQVFLSNRLKKLNKIKEEFDFNNIGVNIHPNYFEEPCKIQVRKISFFDKQLFEKLDSTINKPYELSNKFDYTRIGPDGKKCHNCNAKSLGNSFKALNNNWYFWEGKLFKNLNGYTKGIDGVNKEASSKSRSYTFSEKYVIDGDGYIINLYDNKLLSENSCKIEALLNTNNFDISKFENQKPLINNKLYKTLPYWASNPTYVEFIPSERTIPFSTDNLTEKCENICIHNDSLVFFILPIGYYPKILDFSFNKKIANNISFEVLNKNINDSQNQKDGVNDVGYKYFFRKFNLIDTIPFKPNNFILPKNDAFVITEFNHKNNNLNVIYDAGFSNLMPVKLLLDNSNKLLIVQSIDFIEDNYNSKFSHRFQPSNGGDYNMHFSITIFDLETKRELITIPGKINDLTEKNQLIVNGYTVWHPKYIYYDQLDLNELIINKSAFKSPKIENSLKLDEFMSNVDLERKIKVLRKETHAKSQKLFTVKKEQESIISNNYNEFLNYVSSQNSSLCECFYNRLNQLPDSIIISFQYIEYNLLNKQLKLEATLLDDFKFKYLRELKCDHYFDYDCYRKLTNGVSYDINIDYEKNKVTLLLNNLDSDFAKKIKDDIKVHIDFDHNTIFNPENIANYHRNELVKDCVNSVDNINKVKINKQLDSMGRINDNYVSYAYFYLVLGGDKIFLKSR